MLIELKATTNQERRKMSNPLNPSASTSLLPHFLVKPTDEGLRCTSISTASSLPVTSSRMKLSSCPDICRKKSFDFAAADTSRCERVAWAGNSRNSKSLIWAICIPAKRAERSQNPLWDSFQNSTLYTLSVVRSTSSAWGVYFLSPPRVFCAWNNKTHSLCSLSLRKKKKPFELLSQMSPERLY